MFAPITPKGAGRYPPVHSTESYPIVMPVADGRVLVGGLPNWERGTVSEIVKSRFCNNNSEPAGINPSPT